MNTIFASQAGVEVGEFYYSDRWGSGRQTVLEVVVIRNFRKNRGRNCDLRGARRISTNRTYIPDRCPSIL